MASGFILLEVGAGAEEVFATLVVKVGRILTVRIHPSTIFEEIIDSWFGHFVWDTFADGFAHDGVGGELLAEMVIPVGDVKIGQ